MTKTKKGERIDVIKLLFQSNYKLKAAKGAQKNPKATWVSLCVRTNSSVQTVQVSPADLRLFFSWILHPPSSSALAFDCEWSLQEKQHDDV